MSDTKYKRILLKISGEALAGDKKSGIDDDVVRKCLFRRLSMFDFGRDIFLVACGKFKRERLGIDQIVCGLLQDFGCQKVVALGYHPSRWPRFNNRESKVIKTLKSERMRLKL